MSFCAFAQLVTTVFFPHVIHETTAKNQHKCKAHISNFKVQSKIENENIYHLLMAHPVSIASKNQANFGTTVTVIVSKKEPNLKSSLKKPKVISDEDEGFIDEISANNSTDIINNANKKVVQFKTQITEIPTLEIKSHHTRSRAAAATILPPLSSADEKRIEQSSPKKSKNHGKQTFSGLKHSG